MSSLPASAQRSAIEAIFRKEKDDSVGGIFVDLWSHYSSDDDRDWMKQVARQLRPGQRDMACTFAVLKGEWALAEHLRSRTRRKALRRRMVGLAVLDLEHNGWLGADRHGSLMARTNREMGNLFNTAACIGTVPLMERTLSFVRHPARLRLALRTTVNHCRPAGLRFLLDAGVPCVWKGIDALSVAMEGPVRGPNRTTREDLDDLVLIINLLIPHCDAEAALRRGLLAARAEAPVSSTQPPPFARFLSCWKRLDLLAPYLKDDQVAELLAAAPSTEEMPIARRRHAACVWNGALPNAAPPIHQAPRL